MSYHKQWICAPILAFLMLQGCGTNDNNSASSSPKNQSNSREALTLIFFNVSMGQTGDLAFLIEKQGQDLVVKENIKVSPPESDKEQKGPSSVEIISKIDVEKKTAHISAGTWTDHVKLSDEQLASLKEFLGAGAKAVFIGRLSKTKLDGNLTISDAHGQVLSKSDFERSAPDNIFPVMFLEQSLNHLIKWITPSKT